MAITVLVVDDTTFMRTTLKRMLVKNNITSIFEAADGKEAINKYKMSHPDLVIMDISMPVMNGIDAIKEIKKLSKEAKIIICSLQGQKENVMEGIKAGAKSFLVKPIKEDKLMNEIRKAFTDVDMDALNNDIEKINESIEEVKASIEFLDGIEAGHKECKREITTNMIKCGLELDMIKKCVELSEEEIEELAKEYNL